MKKYILTVRKDLLIMLIGSIILLFSLEFLILGNSSIGSRGHKVFNIISKLSLAYISAFIFYFLNIHIKQERDKFHTHPYISDRLERIVGDGIGLFHNLSRSIGGNGGDSIPSHEEILDVFSKVNPYGESGVYFMDMSRQKNWIEYMGNQKGRTLNQITNLFRQINYLDVEVIKLLVKIEDSTYFLVLQGMVDIHGVGQKMKNQDLSVLSQNFIEYTKLLSDLRKLNNKKYKPYK